MNSVTDGNIAEEDVVLATTDFEQCCRMLALRNEQQFRERKIHAAREREAKKNRRQ